MKTTMKEEAGMKKRRGLVLAVLFLVGLMVAVSGSALAIVGGTGNTGGGGSCVDPYINPSASGAKITGTVNVIYFSTGSGTGLWNLAITMRVVKGTQLYYFWRVTDPVSMADCGSTVEAINQFVNEDVISTVYPTLSNKKPAPTAVLKGGTMDVGTVIGNAYTSQTDSPFPWFMLDFEYAVQ